MNILFYSPSLKGHFLEYTHYVYDYACKKKDSTFVFLLPDSFDSVKDKLDWNKSSNIIWEFFDCSYSEKPVGNYFQMLINTLRTNYIVAKTVRSYNIQQIFTNLLIEMVPWAPLLFPRSIKIVGIVYRIYLYDDCSRSRISLLFDKLKYWILTHSSVFKNILILNDNQASSLLNSKYSTCKFVMIPDPYVPILTDNKINIRDIYNIEENRIVFVHFGALNTNKGTIELLKSLELLDNHEKKEYVFIIAGSVSEDIKESFYALYNKLKDSVKIIIKDEFCSYEYLAALCETCNALVLPYKRTAQSSGLIGYASQFHKPVIAPNKGLLGRLIKEYDLGLLIDDISSEALVNAYKLVAQKKIEAPSDRYCKNNNVQLYQEVVNNCLFNN